MNTTREEVERKVDNALVRIRILATVAGVPDRIVDAIETERDLVRSTIRSLGADGQR